MAARSADEGDNDQFVVRSADKGDNDPFVARSADKGDNDQFVVRSADEGDNARLWRCQRTTEMMLVCGAVSGQWR